MFTDLFSGKAGPVSHVLLSGTIADMDPYPIYAGLGGLDNLMDALNSVVHEDVESP